MKSLAKAIVFCGVCALTWAATHSIQAQQKARRGGGTAAVTPARASGQVAGDVIRLSEGAPGPAFTEVELGQPGMVAEVFLRSGGITIADGIATASAHVSMADKRQGMAYVWRLQVVDKEGRTLAGQVYDQQIFTMEANGQREVDFMDSVAIPPHAYRVELVLYKLSPGDDLSVIDDDTKARTQQQIRLVKHPGR